MNTVDTYDEILKTIRATKNRLDVAAVNDSRLSESPEYVRRSKNFNEALHELDKIVKSLMKQKGEP